MKKVNLRDLYPDVYKNDHFVEVTEDVLEAIRAAERAEAAYDRKMYRYKAYYSLDNDNVPSKKQKTSPWYRCPTRGCDCRAIKCDFAEESILKAMKEWLAEYTVNIETEKTIQVDPVETALKVVREQLAETQLQQDKICEYLEKGVYTVEMFTKRNDTLTREMRKLQASEADLLKKQSSQSDIKNAEAEIIPTTQRILDSYSRLSVPEKNSLWKIVMEKITMYRTPDGEFSMHIYQKLPMKN